VAQAIASEYRDEAANLPIEQRLKLVPGTASKAKASTSN